MLQRALEQLRRYFGYNSFKMGQQPLIEGILHRKDVLGVMPTGAGKSICYQLPAAILDGITLVISPLISLMKDQVDALNQTGIPTAVINSTLSVRELNDTMEDLAAGRYKVVYIAPERLESERFIRLVEQLTIPLVAVDEAHCVSQWGHDFRPSYMGIARLLKHIHPRPVVAAFTATATDKVKQDIIQHLKMDHPVQITTGYARDNLSFSVIKGIDKKRFFVDYVKSRIADSGIIYASTRKEVEVCHRDLIRMGIQAGRYHAGLGEEERARNQEMFLYDELKVMVATNAFGMGIDKSNVRYVLHYNMPKNLESYYQEAGRAGRDGEPGECLLLYSPQDIMMQKFLIEQKDDGDERKQIEYANLNDMVDYCHTTECLQQYVSRYFGDADVKSCGQCGNCTDDREVADITREAQIIFSCIVRMRKRFGITLTAKVLRGASDAKVRQFGFDALPTYGAMKQYKERDIVNLINVLVADGYLRLADNKFPVVSLADKAKAVLTGNMQVFQRIALTPAASTSAPRIANEALFDRLRQLRKSFADRQKVPPFTIFHDATLREMCERLPETEADMLTIKGVGQNKYMRYGEAFLRVIREEE